MSTCCSSDEMASSHTSSNTEFMTTGSDAETRSHSSLADSLESEACEVNGGKSTEVSLTRSSLSRLPRLQRSHTFNTRSPVNKSASHANTRQDERNARGRFSASKEDFACLPHADCGSTHSLCHWNTDGKAQVRENTTSKRRFQLQHSLHEREAETPEYITPSQRKDHLIKELKAQVRELKQALQDRDMEAEQMKLELKEEATEEVEKRNEELENVRKELEDMKSKYDDLTKSYEESVKAVTTMEQTMDELKVSVFVLPYYSIDFTHCKSHTLTLVDHTANLLHTVPRARLDACLCRPLYNASMGFRHLCYNCTGYACQ